MLMLLMCWGKMCGVSDAMLPFLEVLMVTTKDYWCRATGITGQWT